MTSPAEFLVNTQPQVVEGGESMFMPLHVKDTQISPCPVGHSLAIVEKRLCTVSRINLDAN